MVLTVDIGNSSTRCGVFKDEALLAHWAIPTKRDEDARWYARTLKKAFDHAKVAVEEIRHVVVGSVVPEAAGLREALKLLFKEAVVWADHRMDFGLEIEYDDPSAVGVDRLAAASAAAEFYGVPVIVVDVGTAITIDAVTAERRFVAGAIAPGMQMGADALHRDTSLLPRVELGRTPGLTGRSTADCIRCGLFWGAVGLIDGLVERWRAQLVPEAYVVASGGEADSIAEASQCIRAVNPHLVLWGLYLLWKRSAASHQ